MADPVWVVDTSSIIEIRRSVPNVERRKLFARCQSWLWKAKDSPRRMSLNTAAGLLGIPSVPLRGLLHAKSNSQRPDDG